MKILTVCIVCRNENTMLHKVLESCTLLRDDIEVILLGEEGTLLTCEVLKCVEKYSQDFKVYPTTSLNFLKVGIQQASGLYFKMLDANDSLDTSVLVKVVETCKDLLRIQANLDMMVCNYQFINKKKRKDTVKYNNVFALDKVFQWHQTKHFKSMQKISIESIIVKTNILKKVDFFDTSYNEELLVLKMLPCIKCIYYLDNSLQNVTTRKYRYLSLPDYETIIKDIVDEIDMTNIESRKLRNYIINHINSLLIISNQKWIKQSGVQSIKFKKEILEYIRIKNPTLYRALKKTTSFRVYASNIKFMEVLNLNKKTK